MRYVNNEDAGDMDAMNAGGASEARFEEARERYSVEHVPEALYGDTPWAVLDSEGDPIEWYATQGEAEGAADTWAREDLEA